MTAAVRLTGQDPDGRWIIGRRVPNADVATLVPRMFYAGWHRLQVINQAGDTVGWIGPKHEGGRREWGVAE